MTQTLQAEAISAQKKAFSGIKPTGEATLGTILGAVKNWVVDQGSDSYFCIVDLHALTVPQNPAELLRRTYEITATFIAVGLDPLRTNIFVQSRIPEHTQLSWLLECTASFGELRRMTQFKDRYKKAESVSAGLFTYPVLMSADILLYNTDIVPVGEDQVQHVELARNIAQRFNARYGKRLRCHKQRLTRQGHVSAIFSGQQPRCQNQKIQVAPFY